MNVGELFFLLSGAAVLTVKIRLGPLLGRTYLPIRESHSVWKPHKDRQFQGRRPHSLDQILRIHILPSWSLRTTIPHQQVAAASCYSQSCQCLTVRQSEDEALIDIFAYNCLLVADSSSHEYHRCN